jgi:hypothetical protein
MFPELEAIIDEFEAMIVWKSSGGDKEDVPEPMPGIEPVFDEAN